MLLGTTNSFARQACPKVKRTIKHMHKAIFWFLPQKLITSWEIDKLIWNSGNAWSRALILENTDKIQKGLKILDRENLILKFCSTPALAVPSTIQGRWRTILSECVWRKGQTPQLRHIELQTILNWWLDKSFYCCLDLFKFPFTL